MARTSLWTEEQLKKEIELSYDHKSTLAEHGWGNTVVDLMQQIDEKDKRIKEFEEACHAIVNYWEKGYLGGTGPKSNGALKNIKAMLPELEKNE